jgi:hypothetical protein
VTARRHTGVSSFTDLDVPPDAARMSPLAITMGDLDLQIEGLQEGATAMLFVRAGALARLECVTNAGVWPDDPRVTNIGYLRYERAPSGAYQLIPVAQRDAQTLALQLAGHKSSIPDPALSEAVVALPRAAVLQQPVNAMADVTAAVEVGFAHHALLVPEHLLGPAFHDLRSGLAGELLQKFANYRMPLAIVVSDAKAHGDRFAELVHEHRAHPLVRFFASDDQARAWLATCIKES